MRKSILFLCTGNSCRSQMAEGLLRHMYSDRFEAYSAGVDPTDVNPLAVRVMEEIGIDISGQQSKSLESLGDMTFDYVITLCDNARRTCPLFPGSHQLLHWSIEDPAAAKGTEAQRLPVFRNIRDRIKQRINELVAQ